MIDIRIERSGGFAGAAFVVLMILGMFVYGIPPAISLSAGDVSQFVLDHRTQWLIGAWLVLPQTAAFLWFLVQLRAYLRLVRGPDDGLPIYVVLAGVAAGSVTIVAAILQAALGFQPGDIGLTSIRTLFDTYMVAGVFEFVPYTLILIAASLSGLRHNSLPPWICYLGYLAAAGNAIASFSIFYRHGFLALNGMGTMLIAMLPLLVWVTALSLVLIQHPRSEPE